jgi:hypothetical protein
MHELTEHELYLALEYAKSLDEHKGRRILMGFEADQPLLFQTLFSVFPGIIAEQSQDLAHYFMDLCFEVICVYQHAFGAPPKFADDPTWMERQAVLLGEEFHAVMHKQVLDEANKKKLQAHFMGSGAIKVQAGLVRFMNESIDEFASNHASRVEAGQFTQAMILMVVRLFNSLYDQPVKH